MPHQLFLHRSLHFGITILAHRGIGGDLGRLSQSFQQVILICSV